MEKSFTEHTEEYVSRIPLAVRKNKGQYMTPYSLGKAMASLFRYADGDKILDPAAGTGELLRAVMSTTKAAVVLHGWDADADILKVAGLNVKQGAFESRNIFRSLTPQEFGSFDKIIGNPPYFEVKKNDPRLGSYGGVLKDSKGRVNIYALFFEYALELLKEGGELVYLVPPSMNNGSYFADLREYILNHSYIKHIEIIRESSKFKDATTSVQIIHLIKSADSYEQNLKKSAKHVTDFNKLLNTTNLPTIFTEDSKKLHAFWENKTNLHSLGYEVTTGATIWNQNKELFQPEETNHTSPLIYSKDITKDNTLLYAESLNGRRWLPKNLNGYETEKTIIVNRIVGGLTNPQLRWAETVSGGHYTENHVNVIKPAKNSGANIETLTKALTSHPVPSEYLQLLTGNTQLSATELQYLTPFPKNGDQYD